ncbi:hypothetical protein C7R28_03870 [Staphylococcus aureus]|nr:hypothetical protein [Staphylococcus aureus]PGG82064.1 hypothetical protein CRU80_07875 [Staphylococcus aureus]PNN89179.1 hypothetical protein RK87_007595 [Staphylococcus aureus]PSM67352.1 hypothetical protein B9Y46_12920 [Staphylococcus aureus]PSN04279.1 hypothetical protein B9Y28_07440 [Staphylococcus aureus]
MIVYYFNEIPLLIGKFLYLLGNSLIFCDCEKMYNLIKAIVLGILKYLKTRHLHIVFLYVGGYKYGKIWIEFL